jgi:hypothetical protein
LAATHEARFACAVTHVARERTEIRGSRCDCDHQASSEWALILQWPVNRRLSKEEIMTRLSTLTHLLASFVLGSTIFTASSGATFAGGLDGLGKGLSGVSVNVSVPIGGGGKGGTKVTVAGSPKGTGVNCNTTLTTGSNGQATVSAGCSPK